MCRSVRLTTAVDDLVVAFCAVSRIAGASRIGSYVQCELPCNRDSVPQSVVSDQCAGRAVVGRHPSFAVRAVGAMNGPVIARIFVAGADPRIVVVCIAAARSRVALSTAAAPSRAGEMARKEGKGGAR
jgi:hypothetical protein